VAISTARIACSVPRTASVTIITVCRGSRSATTPPTRTNSTSGPAYAVSTSPTSLGFPVSRVTNSPIATSTSASPTTLADWPSQSSRKSRERRAGSMP